MAKISDIFTSVCFYDTIKKRLSQINFEMAFFVSAKKSGKS